MKPHHLKRYKDIALLLLKHGRSELATEYRLDGPLEQARKEESPVEEKRPSDGRQSKSDPEALADDLEKMGPTFIKLGQMLSGRPDLLPAPYVKALSRLQDKVKPFPYEEVEKTVAAELGVRISKGFSYFEERQVAAASLGQVHRAALRDGRLVVVKVQRPEVRKQVAEDFEVLEGIAAFFDGHTDVGRRYQFVKVLAEFKTVLEQELDYANEAANLTTLARNLSEFPHIFVPLPVHDYSAHRVLTMDYVAGTKITGLSPVVKLEVDGDALAEQLFQAYLKQVLVDGFFHADPHPGNIFLTEDGRLALLDLGMVGRVAPAMQENLLRLLIAVSDGDGDDAAKIVLRASDRSDGCDESAFRKQAALLVAIQSGKTIEEQEVGLSLLKLGRTASDAGLYPQSELTMLGKALMQLDQVGKVLAPHFDPNASIRRNVAKITTRRMIRNVSPGKVFGSMIEMKDFVGGLPERMNKLLDAAANAQLHLNVKTPDAHHLLNGFEKIANRITTGVILAALIVGAALLMQVNTTRFRILGYPGLAMLCFLAAVGGSVWLVLSILIKDYKDSRKRRD